jgi:hypothetical protein
MKFITALALISIAFGAVLPATAVGSIQTDTTKCMIIYTTTLATAATAGMTTICSIFHCSGITITVSDTGITCIVTHTGATTLTCTCDLVTAVSATAATAGGKVSEFTCASSGTVSLTVIAMTITFSTIVWDKSYVDSSLTVGAANTVWAGANAATAATTVYTLNGVLAAASGRINYLTTCSEKAMTTTVTTTATCVSDAASSWLVLGAISLLGAASFF